MGRKEQCEAGPDPAGEAAQPAAAEGAYGMVTRAETVLLLDFDHTLYPSTLKTQLEVDKRINLYIETLLSLTPREADALRRDLWADFGTTLRGLHVRHGVDPHHYCDFIHAIEDIHLPPPDPGLGDWLGRLKRPAYIFTNARSDWASRAWKAMGLGQLPEGLRNPRTAGVSAIRGVLDIVFTGWVGKPHADAYDKVEGFLREAHGRDLRIVFADDRTDNLLAARERGWETVWVRPHGVEGSPWREVFDHVLDSLVELDPALP